MPSQKIPGGIFLLSAGLQCDRQKKAAFDEI
jgi:hypothetical protein